MVENNTSESISEQDTLIGNPINIQENLIASEISSTVQAVLMQCSASIFKVISCLVLNRLLLKIIELFTWTYFTVTEESFVFPAGFLN